MIVNGGALPLFPFPPRERAEAVTPSASSARRRSLLITIVSSTVPLPSVLSLISFSCCKQA